ncbi:hypothetical protein PFISCL1PPCAC_25694 [Pristionchus fissidentatus]|uniref:Type VI secretion protein n=1 Tax=Pristionchus fissidentatus TaxID=1538716 RepID=A0AAV5WTJ5_9BILA|nr:hypothetical protein PFISCL1PPCAC_25694 [Pristionchus fissidentatus]
MAHTDDDENPAMSTTKFLIFKDPDPGFSQTAISVLTNFVLSNMMLYGVTGNARMAYLTSLITIPVSAVMCVRDSRNDYEKWKEMRLLKLKGVPDRFLPHRCKYDWTDYDRKKALSPRE